MAGSVAGRLLRVVEKGAPGGAEFRAPPADAEPLTDLLSL